MITFFHNFINKIDEINNNNKDCLQTIIYRLNISPVKANSYFSVKNRKQIVKNIAWSTLYPSIL